ncbi:MAG: hypothetical protein A3C36_04050 [Omnitrophica WOR_2 bacterium RIFCSPHIGHO2_02_FULL_52_10]|nr:MAG: hypothetical protein A3C36_04050 [Omnitrophica WOR_2 bacterium RIFCSPHIGHO2_02_FULL_52_10]
MLNSNEKKEMLRDAANPRRREAFRNTKDASALPTFDDYLRFLDKVHAAFTHAARDVQKSHGTDFKL